MAKREDFWASPRTELGGRSADQCLGTMIDVELGKAIGVTTQAVYQRRRKKGIGAAQPKQNNPGVTQAELDALMARVRETIAYHGAPNMTGASYTEIARRCGVDSRTVRRWVSRRTTPASEMLAEIRAWLARFDPAAQKKDDAL